MFLCGVGSGFGEACYGCVGGGGSKRCYKGRIGRCCGLGNLHIICILLAFLLNVDFQADFADTVKRFLVCHVASEGSVVRHQQ